MNKNALHFFFLKTRQNKKIYFKRLENNKEFRVENTGKREILSQKS